MWRQRRALIISAIALLAALALLVTSANLGQWRASYWRGHAQSCGALLYAAGRLMTATAEARAAEACFTQAVPRCHAATLSASMMGVDTGATDSFLVEPPLGPLGACQIVLTVSHWGLVSIANHTETMTCRNVALTPTSMTIFNCGTLGNITLPATRGAPQGG